MKKGNLIISLIVIALINIGIFVAVDDYSGLFWVNYGFTMLALCFTAYTACFLSKDEKLTPKLNISIAAEIYLIAEIVVSLICSQFDEDYLALVIILHLIVVGAFILFFYITLQNNSFIKSEQQKRTTELLNFRYVLEQMKLIRDKVPYSAGYKKAIDRTYDSLAASQSASSAEVEALEREIIVSINKLNEAVDKQDSDLIEAVCTRINQLSSERDSKLKLRTNF